MSKSLIEKAFDWGLRRSPWLICFNGGACSACAAETQSAFAPGFDLEQLGAVLCETPIHADVLVVNGAVSFSRRERLLEIYEQMPEPKFVIAAGACACSGGVEAGSYSCCGGVDELIPVDIYIPGCPVHPAAVIDAVKRLLDKISTAAEDEE